MHSLVLFTASISVFGHVRYYHMVCWILFLTIILSSVNSFSWNNSYIICFMEIYLTDEFCVTTKTWPTNQPKSWNMYVLTQHCINQTINQLINQIFNPSIHQPCIQVIVDLFPKNNNSKGLFLSMQHCITLLFQWILFVFLYICCFYCCFVWCVVHLVDRQI